MDHPSPKILINKTGTNLKYHRRHGVAEQMVMSTTDSVLCDPSEA